VILNKKLLEKNHYINTESMRGKMRITNIFILVVLFGSLFCAEVDRAQARKVAYNVFNEFKSDDNPNDFKVRKLDIITTDQNDPLIYVFNLSPIGFVLVSAEDKTLPYLGYGFESEFKFKNMPVNLKSLFDLYKREITEYKNLNEGRTQEIQVLWDNYLSEVPTINDYRNVSPLLDAEFDQSGNWNNIVQSEIGFNAPVGCVAVAMAQVMHYWKHPFTGEGSNSYSDNGISLEANFSQAYYDFDNMPATYTNNSVPAAQLLLFHTGVSVNMDYDNSGSGAWVIGPSYPSTQHSMEEYFKYSSNIYHMYKSSSNTDAFLDAIKNNLDNNMPVIMRGYGDDYGGGHAWNIDGYQGDNLSCNWGWGGYSNGYFNLTSMGGFPDGQAILLNIIPRDIEDPIALFDYSIDASTVYFFDLASDINEQELKNYYWNFGDGEALTTTSGNLDHTYQSSGLYMIELIVENIYGMMSEPFIEEISVVAALPGDLNQDQNVDILDIVVMVNLILGGSPTATELFIADLNADEQINIQDIILLLNIIL